MSAVLRLLIAACLIWCAVGVAEPAHADARAAHVAALDLPDDDAGDAVGEHHHCPVAPQLPASIAAAPPSFVATPPARGLCVPLASLSCAPPLQPPSA